MHTSINGYLETELEKISRSNTVISFDFSSRGTGDYFEQVCPWVNYGFISCSGLTLDQIKEKISTLHRCGCQHVIATNGHECVYYFSANGFLQWRPDYIEPVDTLGAGDAFLTGFMLSVLQSGMRDPDHDAVMTAMQTGGKFSARVLSHYGAFGFGKPYRAG